LGLSGRVPRRVDAATKSGLLELIDHATGSDWTVRDACRLLELSEGRAWRWLARRERDGLADRPPGGNPSHGLLDDEVAQIVALFHEWGEVDRSHRKLAHRGSYLGRVWVSPSTVRRVLAGQDLVLRAPPRPGRSKRRPFPEWADYRSNSIWIYDTTHFTVAGVAVTVVEDLVSRKVAGRHRLVRGDLDPDRDRVHRRPRGRGAARSGHRDPGRPRAYRCRR
jgi:putative transposase